MWFCYAIDSTLLGSAFFTAPGWHYSTWTNGGPVDPQKEMFQIIVELQNPGTYLWNL